MDWGDYDGDGDLDLLMTGRNGSGPQSFIYENDDGSFSTIGAGLTGLQYSSANWGDYDNDGDLDLIITGMDINDVPRSLIYENDGSGNFSNINAGLTGLFRGSSDWGDFDGDGDLDLLITGADNSYAPQSLIYENNGNGNFSPIGAGITKVLLSSADWGDYDGDGDLDLLIIGYLNSGTYQSLIYENDGNGNFSDIGAGLTGLSTGAANWGDFDNDSDLDLLITGLDNNNNDQSLIYENNGNGTFTDIGAGLTGLSRGSSNWGDYDGDGDLDLIITGGFNGAQIIYKNNGNGNFSDMGAGITGLYRGSSDWGDFDGDGDLDIAVNGNGDNGFQSLIYENNNAPSAANITISGSLDIGQQLIGNYDYTDQDGDTESGSTYQWYRADDTSGTNETAITGANGQTYTLTSNDARKHIRFEVIPNDGNVAGTAGKSTFQQVQPSDLQLTGTQQSSGAPGTEVDILGSGFDPNASDHTTTFVPAGGGSGTTAPPTGLTGGILTTTVPSGLEAGQYHIKVQRAYDGTNATTTDLFSIVDRGGDNFIEVSAGLTNVYESSADWGDFDNDGDLDIAITGNNGSGPQSLIYRNNGDGTFTDINAGLTGLSRGSAKWGDFDGDDDLDLVITGDDGTSPKSLIYENNGDGTFSDIGAGLTGLFASSADWGDFDGDGDLDLAITGNNGVGPQSLIYENNGGSFSTIGAGLTGLQHGSADWGDFDGDGDLDLLITGSDGSGPQSFIYENDGGSFSKLGAGLTGIGIGDGEWGDFDGDGDLDLILTGDNSSGSLQSLIYENNGDGTFSTINAGLTGVYNSSVNWGDLDGDGDLDLLITGNDGNNSQSLIYENENSNFSNISAGLTGVINGAADLGDFDNDGDLDLIIAGTDGSTIQSLIYKNNNTPTVANVTFSGSMIVGQELTSSYDFSDRDGDTESGSTYQWYRADDASGTNQIAIAGATAQTYTLAPDDAHKYIRFEITPNDGNVAGTAAQNAFSLVASPFAGGSGTQANPYQVATADQLNEVRDFLDNYFIQTADIDLSGYTNWDPIGWDTGSDGANSTAFSGQYNGNSHTISNLTIEKTSTNNTQHVGLFAKISGSLKELTIQNADITGQHFVGILSGQSSGTIQTVSVAGSIEGLLNTGGLVGQLQNGTVTQSYATGTINGANNTGGLVGKNGGSINQSYVLGDVTATQQYVGGLIGTNTSNGSVDKSFSTAKISYNTSQQTDVGGFIGRNQASEKDITNSFWDTETSSYATSAGGTGKPTSEMKDQTTFTAAGWDFSSTWQIEKPSSGTISYPYLQSTAQDPPPGKYVLSQNKNLSALSFSNGTPNPTFASNTTNYTVSVPASVTSVTTSPTLADDNATVTVNGLVVPSGQASNPIPLSYGSNTVNVIVTAEDGSTKTYEVTVSREDKNNDGDLTAAPGVTEPVALRSTVNTKTESLDIFDFNLVDGGSDDGLPLGITAIELHVSGTADPNKITFSLNGPDTTNVTGTFDSNASTLTFSGLSLSISEGGSEVYTVDAHYSATTGLTDGQTIILSVDGDSDLTVDGTGTQMGKTTTINNGIGSTTAVEATQLVFTTQPSDFVSGSPLATPPAITAQDVFGNTDTDFSQAVELTLTDANGTLNSISSNNDEDSSIKQATATLIKGTVTFSGLTFDYVTPNFSEETIAINVSAQGLPGTKSDPIIAKSAIPDKVLLANPGKATVNISLLPTLQWQKPYGAKSYELQLATNSTFSADKLIIDYSGIQDTTHHIQNKLQNATTYYWRVRASNSTGNSKWSETFKFSTIPDVPAKPTLQAPEDGKNNIILTPQLQWQAVDNATTYKVEISQGGNFSAPVAQTETTSLSFTPKASLHHATSYSWRVQAINVGGNSNWAGPYEFMTKSISPTLAFPTNNENKISIAPTLSWNSDYQDGKYRLQLATDSQMQELVLDSLVSAKKLSVAGLQSGSTYYWRVRTESPSTSNWSSPDQFQTRGAEQLQLSTEITFDTSTGSRGSDEKWDSYDYQLIGLPVAKSIPVEQLFDGEYGTEWKVFEDDGTQKDFLHEHTQDNPLSFTTGKGYWVLSKKPLKINEQQPPVPVSKNDTYAITLTPGWNIISTPFNRSVNWQQVQTFNGLSTNLYNYEGSYLNSKKMDPFKAYYVYNDKNTDVMLSVPYTSLDKREPPTKKELAKKANPQKVNITITSKRQQTNTLLSIRYVDDLPRQKEVTRYYPPLQLSKFGAAFINKDNRNRNRLLQTVGDTYEQEKNHYQIEVKSSPQDLLTWKVHMSGLEQSTSVLIVDSEEGRTKILNHDQEYNFITGNGKKTFDIYTGSENILKGIAESLAPQQITLNQNYPNPFNPQTTIRFGLNKKADVQLAVYDILGRKIHTLIDENRSAGWYEIPFDGSRLASGTYFYRIVIGQQVITKKMTLIK
nr:FG-GAP-like repeat-containing protein [Fodinibius halophilus]